MVVEVLAGLRRRQPWRGGKVTGARGVACSQDAGQLNYIREQHAVLMTHNSAQRTGASLREQLPLPLVQAG